MLGIQLGAVSCVGEGTGKVLNIFRDRAAINTFFLEAFTYGRGIAGRQAPGQPLRTTGSRRLLDENERGNAAFLSAVARAG